MHIVVIPSWYSSDDNVVLGSFFKEQALALKESGEEVTVCYNEIFPIYNALKCTRHFVRPISSLKEDGLDTYRYRGINYLLHSHRRFNLFAYRICKLIERVIKDKGKIDILHFHSCFWAGICAPYVKKKFGIPYILTEHTGITYSNRILPKYMGYVKEAYDNASILISVSKFLRDEMSSVTNREIEVIYNFLDAGKFKILKGVRENKFVFFSLAFLVDGKGFKELIDAARILRDKGYDFILKIGGDGYLREELENKVREYNLFSYIEFLGMLTRDQVIFAMNKCDSFILASSYETFGVVYIEALACGKPIIGVKNGGAEEIINDKVGIIIDDNSISNIVDAMEKMICDYRHYEEETIREYFLNNFEKSIIIDRLKDVYRACLRKEE